MYDLNRPDGIVTYVLMEDLSTVSGRMYGFHPDDPLTELARPDDRRPHRVKLPPMRTNPERKIYITNGTQKDPVLLGIQIKGPSGTDYFPKSILVRVVGHHHDHDHERTVFPKAFVTNGGLCLVLVDDEDKPASYDFYVLFTDVTGQYRGWLDPKLDNGHPPLPAQPAKPPSHNSR